MRMEVLLPVRPEEAEHLALFDAERDAVHRDLRAKGFLQVSDFDHVWGWKTRASSRWCGWSNDN
jgi:hypothetical protein